MSKKLKVLQIANIVFTAILFALFVLITLMAIEILVDISKYTPNADSNTLGIGLGFVFFLIFSISGLIPLVLNVIIGAMGIKRGSAICKICVIINIAILLITVIFFASILLYSGSKGITLLS